MSALTCEIACAIETLHSFVWSWHLSHLHLDIMAKGLLFVQREPQPLLHYVLL